MNTFSNLYPCQTTPGVYTANFCCGDPLAKAPSHGCCGVSNASFSGVFGTLHSVAGSAHNISSPASTSSSPSTSTSLSPLNNSTTFRPTTILTTPGASSFPTPAQSSAAPRESTTSRYTTPSMKGTAVGVAVGVPVGVVLLAGLAFLYHRERKSRRYLEQQLQRLQPTSLENEGSGREFQSNERQDFAPYTQELHYWQMQPELHPDSRVEMAGR